MKKYLSKKKEHNASQVEIGNVYYVNKDGNRVPEEVRFPEVTITMENGVQIRFYDAENPVKLSELEKELSLLSQKTRVLAYYPHKNIKKMTPGQSLGLVDAIDKLSTPPVTKAELEFFRLEHELEKLEDYSVHNPTRYCGLKIKPKEDMKLEEIFTKETECSYKEEYCEKCETSKEIKDRVQKQSAFKNEGDKK